MRSACFPALALVMLSPLLARSAVLRVPEDYPSVLAGVDAAVLGDSVLVGPGTWTQRAARTVVVLGTPQTLLGAMFLKPGITVIGTAGPTATVLDGGIDTGGVPVYTVIHVLPGSEDARVVGFTITGGGHGVTAAGASPLEMTACHIERNQKDAIRSAEQSLALKDCSISENELGRDPPSTTGAVFATDTELACEGCTYAANVGPGLRVDGSLQGVILRDCSFFDHQLRGAVIADAASLEIERCLFLRNRTSSAGAGGGLTIVRCTGSLRFCTFAFDSAGSGGGASLAMSLVRAENNTFYGCHGSISAGALFIDGTDDGTTRNVFDHSTGLRGAVRKTGGPTHPDTGCNLFWASADGDYFGDWVPAPTDIHADPLFCDPVTLDFGLQAASPAAPPNSGGCGLIGAHEVSCGTVSVEANSWGRVKNPYRSGPASGQGVGR